MAPRRIALVVAALGRAAAACDSDANGPAPPHDAGRDATTAIDAASVGDSRDEGPDGTKDGPSDDGSARDDGEGSGADVAAGDEGWNLPPLAWDACSIFDASALDDASVSAGLAAVEYYDCPICHERQLTRDDAGSIILHLDGNRLGQGIYPPNLTNSPDGLGCWSNAEVVRAILFGLDREGGPLCPPMPVWSKVGMDAGTAAAIADFLRSLPPSESRVPDTTCAPVDLDGGGADAAD